MTKRTRIVDEDVAVKATVFDYTNANPLAVRLTDTDGNYATASGSGGDGAITDGVTASIKATVLDYVNSNPLAVRLTDTAGDYVGAGAGTQYTEDAAAAANPVGTAPILVRADTPAGVVSADGDNVAQRATNYGAAYVQVVSSAGAFVDTFGGGTQYTEDAAAAADPVGTMAMAVRADALAAVTSLDGDNIAARATNKGELYVKHADAIPVTDNGGSLTVDGSVSVTGAVDTELTTADLDTGAGTDTRAVVGLVGSASGGGALIPGSATDGLLVNLGANNDVTVTGSVGINAGTNNIGDVDVLTVPAPLSTTGGGTEATALRVTLASDSTGVVSVDDNGASLTVDNAGTFAVQAAQSGTWTVQPGNTANTTPWLVTDTVATSGGLTMHKTTSAATTNATSVKASAGQVYSIQAFSVNAAVRYLKLYNKASAPTVGTDTPVKTLAIPGNTAGAGFVINWDKGLAFGTGIAFALTTEATDAGTTGVAANEITVNIDYK